jgi:Zn finger protein HypA/HybF involved in hydrogenase expression
VLRGASLECPVCGEFVLHEGAAVSCPECSMHLHGRVESAATGVQSGSQAG